MRKIVTQPSVEPITTAEAKLYLKVDDSTEDTLIATLVKASRISAEKYLRRSLIKTVWALTLDEFPDADQDSTIEVYPAPVSKINSIKYYDADDVEQTLATTEYLCDYASEPCRITLAIGKSWPSISGRANSVTVNYDAGFGTAASSVPELILAAIYLTLGHLYENRQDVTKEKMNELPCGARSLLDMYRVY
jgi:uncharacterized phiE125 gp8 family phage protein